MLKYLFRESKSGRMALIVLCALFGSPTIAEVAVSGVNDIILQAWVGASGDLQGSDTYCVISCNRSCTSRNPRTRAYSVAAYTSGVTDASGNFYLQHTSSANTLLVNLDWSAPTTGIYTLTNYNVTGLSEPPDPFAPGASDCGQPDSQNTLTIRVSSAELASALAGTYAQTFSIDMCRRDPSAAIAECVVPISFVVTLPELVQLTQLDNIVFGPWSGVGDVEATDDFCIFRNGTGGFALTATGSNDVGSSFYLSQGIDQVPYTLDFKDTGATWFNTTPGTTLTSATTGFSGHNTRDCAGGTSHSVRVKLLEADLSAATTGIYSDTVTLLIEPN